MKLLSFSYVFRFLSSFAKIIIFFHNAVQSESTFSYCLLIDCSLLHQTKRLSRKLSFTSGADLISLLFFFFFFFFFLGLPLQKMPKAVSFQIGSRWNLAGICSSRKYQFLVFSTFVVVLVSCYLTSSAGVHHRFHHFFLNKAFNN